MPNADLSKAIKEAYATAPAGQVILHTISLSHSRWVDSLGKAVTLYFVREHKPFTASLEPTDAAGNNRPVVTFKPIAFELELPKIDTIPVPELVIRIDNIGGELLPYLDQAAQSKERIIVTYRPYFSNDDSEPQMIPPLKLTLAEVSVSALVIQGRARLVDVGNRSFPNQDYTLARFPALANV